jgi:aldose 1-epimerase
MVRRLSTALALLAIFSGAQTKVTQQPFGKTKDGRAVEIYTLSDGKVEARIMTYAGIIVSLKAPDRNGNMADVTLGFDSLDGYLGNHPHFGALIGRYGNRIGKGHLVVDGKTYQLAINNGANTLHGGTEGFDRKVWKGKAIPNGVELEYVSADGEEHFPGTLTVTVRYTLVSGALRIDYSATTDKDTVVNLTNHAYWNLAGEGSGDVLKQEMQIFASKITPVDDGLIPTGELKPVAGGPFDFTKPKAIGKDIGSTDQQVVYGKGCDHNFVLDKKSVNGQLVEAAVAHDPASGRTMETWTTEPGVQFYTGNFLDGTIKGKSGHVYAQRNAFCLETQHFPDSPNKPEFPSTLLKPGQKYHTITEYRFSAK